MIELYDLSVEVTHLLAQLANQLIFPKRMRKLYLKTVQEERWKLLIQGAKN